MTNEITAQQAIAHLREQRRWTDSTINDITDVLDDSDAIEQFSGPYLDLLLIIAHAIASGELTIAQLELMI